MDSYYYKVGGALKYNHPTYVLRQADFQLYDYLKSGEYCFILSSRQMGKSSLRVRTSRKLRGEGAKCAGLDLTLISRHTSPEDWYRGFAYQLLEGLGLPAHEILEAQWLNYHSQTHVQKVEALIKSVLFEAFSETIVIFIDEVDSIINAPFKDDFFAFIRGCYNLRADNANFNRLTFCLIGVATPSDLIRDKSRTPFNIGRSIELEGLTLHEARNALSPGLAQVVANPDVVLEQILHWTGGQPFLTQKLCRLVVENAHELNSDITPLVKQFIIDDWEAQDDPEHLGTIRDRLLFDPSRQVAVLGLYQLILTLQDHEAGVVADGSEEEATLKLSGLIRKHGRYLRVTNPIYRMVFNLDWVKSQLNQRRPYSESFSDWIQSHKNPAALLEGQALQEALAWAQGQNLSAVDREFLSESRAQQDQKANLILAAAKLNAEKRLRRSALVAGVTAALALMTVLGTSVYVAHQLNFAKEVIALERATADIDKEDSQLNALLKAIEALQQLRKLAGNQTSLIQYPTVSPVSSLLNVLGQVQEENQMPGHQKAIRALSYSPDGQFLLSGSDDQHIRIWNRSGSLIKSLPVGSSVNSVSYDPQGNFFATAGGDGVIRLWKPNGTLLRRFKRQASQIFSVTVNPRGDILAAGHEDGRVTLWKANGSFLRTIQSNRSSIYSLSISPDGRILAAGDSTGLVHLWQLDGTPIKSIEAHRGAVNHLVFSPDGEEIASASDDKTVKLWTQEGEFTRTLTSSDRKFWSVDFSPDSTTIITGSEDGSIQLWSRGGDLKATLPGQEAIYSIAFSPDGEKIASGSSNGTIQLWRSQATAVASFNVSEHSISRFSPDGQQVAIGGFDGTVQLWTLAQRGASRTQVQRTPQQLTTSGNLVESINFSPNGEMLAVGTDDGSVTLWDLNKNQSRRFLAHRGPVTSISFSVKGQTLATGSEDGAVKLWNSNGTLLKTVFEGESKIETLSFHPQDNTLVTLDANQNLQVWGSDGKLKKSWAKLEPIRDFMFSPDGKMLVSASTLQDLQLQYLGKSTTVSFAGQGLRGKLSVAFSPDGKIIASSSDDGSVNLWKLDGTPLLALKGREDWISGLSFTSDGQSLVAVYASGMVIPWNLNLKLLQQQGCDWLKSYFSSRSEAFNPCPAQN